MHAHWNRQPYMAVVDDDAHSARLLTRMLLAHGAPSIRWIESAAAGKAELGALLADPGSHVPGLVIVNLNALSQATRDFIRAIHALPRSHALVIVAMVPAPERQVREALLDAGADAVFERHADPVAYRQEAAGIVRFWVRSHRLDAVGS